MQPCTSYMLNKQNLCDLHTLCFRLVTHAGTEKQAKYHIMSLASSSSHVSQISFNLAGQSISVLTLQGVGFCYTSHQHQNLALCIFWVSQRPSVKLISPRNVESLHGYMYQFVRDARNMLLAKNDDIICFFFVVSVVSDTTIHA